MLLMSRSQGSTINISFNKESTQGTMEHGVKTNNTGHQTWEKPRLKNNRWGRNQTQLGGIIIDEHNGNRKQEKTYMDIRGREHRRW